MSLKTFDMIGATLIKPSDSNPRGELTELKALSKSIQEHGLISPLVVSKQPDATYALLDGHRRYAAGLSAGLTHFPCVIRDDEDQIMTALVTSSHTVTLSPLEQALAVGMVMESRGIKGAEIARQMSVSATYVSKAKKIYDVVTEENGDRAAKFTDFNKLYEWAVAQGVKKIGRPRAVIDDATLSKLKLAGYAIKKTAEGYAMTIEFSDADTMLSKFDTIKADIDNLKAQKDIEE